MTWGGLNLLPALPEIFLLCAVSAILLIDLFLEEEQRQWTYGLTLFTLAGCAIVQVATAGPQTAYAFNGLFVDDRMSDVLKVCVYIAVAGVLVYSRLYARSRQLMRGEFF